MLLSFATWFTGFKTVFVYSLRPFLPMSVLFFCFNGYFNGKMPKIKKNGQKSLFRGPKWFPKCLNGGFRGVFVLKSGLRILIWAPQVPFSVPPKRPKWVFLAILRVPKMALGVPKSKF